MRVLCAARAICVFHQGMLASLEEFASRMCPEGHAHSAADDAIRIQTKDLLQHVNVIPQAVELPSLPQAHSYPTLHEAAGVPDEEAVVLLPAGIRPVKDVSFCMRAFAEYNARSGATPLHLVVVGPILSHDELARVTAAMDAAHTEARLTQPRMHLLPPVPRPQLLAWMRSSIAVLNSSLSEGMPNAVMEAMALGVPVVVRRNTGNTALVQHGVTGTVFDMPEEAVAACAACANGEGAPGDSAAGKVACSPSGASTVDGGAGLSPSQMAAAGKAHIEEAFSCEAEAAAWLQLLRDVAPPTAPASASEAAGIGSR